MNQQTPAPVSRGYATPSVATAPKTTSHINIPNPARAVQNAANNVGSAVSSVGDTVGNVGTNLKDGINRGVDNVRHEVAQQRRGNMGITMILLFASIGLNIYLGWIAWDTYSRYDAMVSDLRSPRRERYDRDRDIGRPVATAFDDRRTGEPAAY